MARPRCIDADLVGKAKEMVAGARDLETLRSVQAVLLPALLGATLEQTAVLLGLGRATVNRLQRDLRYRCAESVKPVAEHGGRHHELMTLAEEREFLSPWAKSASAGALLLVSPLRAALAQKRGRRVAASGVYRRLARHGWPRYTASEERFAGAGGLGKKRPENLATLAKPEDVKGRRRRLMFQDEARFGRRVRIRKCWACAPDRPVVSNGYEREFVYAYGAVSPLEGDLDWMICRQMNTVPMSAFLSQVSAAHHDEFIVRGVDGASSHVSKERVVPENVRLLRRPPYAPELNPQEHLWDEWREKEFPNRVFADWAGVTRQLESGLPRLATNAESVRGITAWPWIVSLNLNAH